MENASTINALKKLDDLEQELYSPKESNYGSSSKNSKKSDVKSSPIANIPSDGDINDFDDDDLADLLSDGDEFPQKSKKFSSRAEIKESGSPYISPKKTWDSIKKESPTKKKLNLKENFSLLERALSSSEKESHMRDEKISIGDNVDVAKNVIDKKDRSSTILSHSKPLSPAKSSKSKLDLILDEESKYIGDLGLDKLTKSPVPSPRKQSLKKSEISLEDPKPEMEDDVITILDTIGDSGKKTSPARGKGRSFMDDLLGSPKLPAKTTPKKSSAMFDDEISRGQGKDKEDSFLSGYVPSSASGRSAPAGRRQSVMFEDDTIGGHISRGVSSATGMKRDTSPKGDAAVSSKRSVSPSAHNKDDDDDWLSRLKHTEKGLPKAPPLKTDESFNTQKPTVANEIERTRRRSSSTDWLGLKPPELKNIPEESTGGNFSSKQIPDSPIKFESSHTPSREGRRRGQLPWLADSSENGSQGQVPSPKKESVIANEPVMLPKTSSSGVPGSPSRHRAPSSAGSYSNDQSVHSGSMQNLSTRQFQSPSSEQLKSVFVSPETSAIPFSSTPHPQQPLSTAQNADLAALQVLLSSVQFEKEQLEKAVEMEKKKREEELKALEDRLKSEHKAMVEAFEQKIKSLNEEHNDDVAKLKLQLTTMESEKLKLSHECQSKIEVLERGNARELQKVKELHNDAVSMMKEDHKEALERLKRLKDQEVEAISSTQSYARSLQSLSEELQMRAAELATLNNKVDEKHQTAVKEKEALLVAKEKDLKTLEGRLKWQMEEGDQERARLQQLVLRLEKRLQSHTKEGEQDHWEVQQMKAKLEVQQKFLEEEKKIQSENIEREREKLHLTQDSILREQKAIMHQLAQERQQMSTEKMELESLAKRVKAEEARLLARKLKEDSSFENQRQMLHNEDEKLHLDKELLKQERLQLHSEKDAILREKKQLKDERENVEQMKFELKRRADEVEDIMRRASTDRDEGRTALTTARRIEADHHTRMNQLTDQMQMLVGKEKWLLQERENFAVEKAEFEKMKASVLCSNCKLNVAFPVAVLPPHLPSIRQSTPLIASVTSMPRQQTFSDPNLMLWYVTAEKDHEYLKEELEYLHSLNRKK